MKRLLFIIAMLLPVFTYAQKPAPSTYDLLIGTYTKGTSKGILVYRFYVETGRLAFLSEARGPIAVIDANLLPFLLLLYFLNRLPRNCWA